jgi:hypothetical protein
MIILWILAIYIILGLVSGEIWHLGYRIRKRRGHISSAPNRLSQYVFSVLLWPIFTYMFFKVLFARRS